MKAWILVAAGVEDDIVNVCGWTYEPTADEVKLKSDAYNQTEGGLNHFDVETLDLITN